MRISDILFSIILVSTLAASGYAKNGQEVLPGTNVAVLNFTSTLSHNQTMHIRNAFVASLTRRFRDIYVITRGDLLRAIKKNGKQTPASPDDIFKIGSSIKRDFIIWGHAGRDSQLVYSATIKILDIKNNSIIFDRTITEKDFDDVLAHVPAITAEASKRISYRAMDSFPRTVTASFVYFNAGNSFDGVINSGYGVDASYILSTLIAGLSFGCSVQVLYAEGDKAYTDRAWLVPITIFTSYSFSPGPVRITPLLHTGRLYSTIYYYTEKSGVFDKREGQNWLARPGIQFDVAVTEHLALFAAYEYGIVIDDFHFKDYHTVMAGIRIGLW